jgi:hypothetical protein
MDAPADPRSSLPIRERRKLALLAELGWNGLAGFGLMLTYNAHPHLAFDLAGGFSTTGWKAGVRARYNLLTGPFTPFVGAGFSASTGLDGARVGRGDGRSDPNDDNFDEREMGTYDVKASRFAQGVLGFEFIHHHGFTLQGSAGYSWLLNNHRNFTFVEGRRDDTAARIFFGSGPVISAAFGYAFN